MSNETYYSMQIIRIEDIPEKAKNVALLVEVEFDKVVRKTGYLDSEGQPARNDVLIFSRSDSGTGSFTIRLKESSGLVGHVIVDAKGLLHESEGDDVRLNFQTKKPFRRKHSEDTSSIILRVKSIDAQARAEIEINAAEQSIRQIEDLVHRTEDRDEVIGTVISVVDGIVGIVDDIAEIHPVFNVSWKAVTALYNLVRYQVQKDGELLELVETMRTAFDFSKAADKLEDRSQQVKPIVKELLVKTVDCSRFVKGYAKHNFLRRMSRVDGTKKIEEYSKEFDKLRKDLDTAIVLNTNKDVQDIKLLQQLDALLLPIKSDPSAISNRPRCLKGTRQECLNLIMEFLSDTASPNILWLTGAAGTGKSTIAVTASDMSGSNGRPPTYMFFEREKSDPNSVIRTIAYTLASLHPPVAQYVQKVLEVNPTIRGTSLQNQFEKLLLEPLRAVAADIVYPIVIALDAFDECGNMGQRRDLLRLLLNEFVALPSNVRVLVTSRPEEDVMEGLLTTDCIQHETLRHDSKESRWDVDHYIRLGMAEALGKEELKGKAWDRKLQVLYDAADGLFIWASTAIKMVDGPVKVREKKLERLVNDVRSVGGGIDGLYGTALKGSGVWEDPDLQDAGTMILGFISISKAAISSAAIAAFLDLDEDIVDGVLSQLRSIVSYEPGKPVQLHHASVADYLLSPARSEGKPWHVDGIQHKQNATERCFDIMNSLRFNICDIETSCVPNSEIPGLNERIKENISQHLSYACRFWSAHICELERPGSSDQVPKGLKSFMEDKLLYWLEVLSLTESFNRVASRALREASSWVELADEEISSFLWSAYNLVAIFASPISQSVPHIYLSAISFWKDESPIAARYSRMHPVVDVCTVGMRVPFRSIKVLRVANHVRSVAVSNDGRRIASSSYNGIRIWDTDSGEALWSNLEMDDCDAVAFSPNGEHLVSCSRKGTVCTWDVSSGKFMSTFYTAVVDLSDWNETTVTCSSDGKRVVSLSNKRVSIFDVDDGKLQLVPDAFRDDTDVQFCAVSRDGKYVAGTKSGTIAIWDCGTGEQSLKADIDMPNPIAVSPDGKRVVAVSWDGIRILSIDSGDRVVKKPIRGVFCAAFSWDGKRIVSGSVEGEIAILDADSGDVIWGPVRGHAGPVVSVTFTSDGKRVISGSADRTIRIWDVSGGKVSSGSSDAHTDSVHSVAFYPDGKRIVSGSRDCTVRVWDGEAGKLVAGPFKGHTHMVNSVAFSPDGNRVASGSADGTIRIWDLDSGKLASTPIEGHEGLFFSVSFSADSKRIVSGSSDKTVCVWDASSGELVKGPFKGHTDVVHSVSFSLDGKSIVSGSDDTTVCIWNVETGELRHRLEGHSYYVSSVTFSPEGKHVASGSWDKTIRIWDAGSGNLVLQPFKAHISTVSSVSYSPDGKFIVSGSNDKTVCVWDVETGELVLGPLEGHTDFVWSVTFSPDGKHVASGSWDKTVRVWDVCGDSFVSGRDGVHAGGSEASSSSHYNGTVATSHGETGIPKSLWVRTSLDWKLHEDGWVKGKGGELLVWIPEDRRATLWRPRNTAVFSCEFSTRLDFSSSRIGENWAKGYPLPR